MSSEKMLFAEYLKRLIEEKGCSIYDEIGIDGQFGLTWKHLIEFLETTPEFHNEIFKTLTKIDFFNLNIFDYLIHLANGMIKCANLDT